MKYNRIQTEEVDRSFIFTNPNEILMKADWTIEINP